MKKGFTLVEMLIVVVVLVTLMTIVFRLSSIGSEQTYRNLTISRLQRVENCLSGYYAAFGTYPPVKLHGSRNIYAAVNEYGIQSDEKENKDIWGWTTVGSEQEFRAWEQVKAACKSQPVDCRYPYPADSAYNAFVKAVSDTLKRQAETAGGISEERKEVLSQGFDNGVTDNIGRHDRSATDWRDLQLFKFGLMSYLLPRYLVMMNSNENLYSDNYAQWGSNNTLPCDQFTGEPLAGGWGFVYEYSKDTAKADDPKNYAKIANIPSQAVCARWMPNLERSVACNHDYKLYGIHIRDGNDATELRGDNMNIEIFRPGGFEGGGGTPYVLDGVTVKDGWDNEFFYYSPPPHQNYTLWSAGPNGRTFPPWISRKTLDSTANKCVGLWVEDDIVRMSN